MDQLSGRGPRLYLQGTLNVRDLGGFLTREDKFTKSHAFIRASSLSALTPDDVRFLLDYGVRTVVDLRDYHEVQANPDVLEGHPDIEYHNYPLFGGNIADLTWMNTQEDGLSVLWMYESGVTNTEAVRKIFTAFADAPEGCILFHCAAGKDRTGIVAMLLLRLADVGSADIVADYVLSRDIMLDDPEFRRWWEEGSDRDRSFLDSAPESIQHAMNVVRGYGGIRPYLRECGLTDEQIERVRARLVD